VATAENREDRLDSLAQRPPVKELEPISPCSTRIVVVKAAAGDEQTVLYSTCSRSKAC
jgi:hypothetical protein